MSAVASVSSHRYFHHKFVPVESISDTKVDTISDSIEVNTSISVFGVCSIYSSLFLVNYMNGEFWGKFSMCLE